MDAKEKIARRAVLELKDGAVTNIGLGIPNEVFKYLPKEVSPLLHAENGAVAVGPAPKIGQQQPYLSNAAGFPITLLPHGSVFDICTSQAIMRGGHVDVSIIGAMQVDQLGGIANWGTSPKPGKYVPGIGGAMDLIAGVKHIVAVLEHTDKKGDPKVVKKCNMPLTGYGVKTIITEKAVFEVTPDGLVLTELAPELTIEELKKVTDADFTQAPNVIAYRMVQ